MVTENFQNDAQLDGTSPVAPPKDCPLEEVLDFLSGAWTTQVLWYLQFGPKRFGELKRHLSGVSAKMLTVRLRELESRNVISRTVLPTSPPMVEYALTDLGTQFQPIFQKIAEVGVLLQAQAVNTKPQPPSGHAQPPTLQTQASLDV